jgi:SMODS and SLOG-associating 2TM effector domain 1
LLKQTDRLLSQVGDLAGETIGMPDADKPVPDVHDVASYLRTRVRPQITKYYQPQAAKQQQRLALFRGIEFTLSLLAALLGAVAAATRLDDVGVWVAVVTTVGAAITAHIAAARYEHLVISYLSTTRQLRSLLRS